MQYNQYNARNQHPSKKKKRRIKARFYVFVAVFLLLISLGVFGIVSLFGSPSNVTLGYGMLQDENSMQALILRDETVVSVSAYSKISYIATENQNVHAGDEIMTIYLQGFTDNLLKELEEVRSQITKYQQNNTLSNIKNADLARMEEMISEKMVEIKSFVLGLTKARLVDLERDLRVLMTQRQELIKRTPRSMEEAELDRLYEQEATLMDKITAYKDLEKNKAPIDGRVSYLFDGYEYFLNQEKLPLLTVENVAALMNSQVTPTLPPEEKDKSQSKLYRIVTPNRWNALLLAKASDWKFAAGSVCEMHFENFDDLIFSAQVESITGTGDQVLVVLSMSEDIGPLINARHVNAVIGGRVEGFIVPLTAIKDNGIQKGVYQEDGQTFVPVNIIGKDEKNALVMPVEEAGLTLGMKVRGK